MLETQKDGDDVKVVPAIQDIERFSNQFRSSEIIFRTNSSMFTCFGIVVVSRSHDFVFKRCSNESSPAYRVLGGVQWRKNDSENPLHIFPGKSCAVHANANERNSKDQSFTLANIYWDVDNDSFACDVIRC